MPGCAALRAEHATKVEAQAAISRLSILSVSKGSGHLLHPNPRPFLRPGRIFLGQVITPFLLFCFLFLLLFIIFTCCFSCVWGFNSQVQKAQGKKA